MDRIRTAAHLLKNGELVAFPTETVYGLGANALNHAAVEGIYVAKGRPVDNPIIVHLESFAQVASVCRQIPASTGLLAETFWPGPLTLVLAAGPGVPRSVTGGLNTVAVRVPDHPVALALIREAGCPVAAPSANLSGRPSPTRASHVLQDLHGRIAAVLDGGDCRVGLESTVLDITGDIPRILRPGGVTLEDLKSVLPQVLPPPVGFTGQAPPSPGMKYRHYAPRAPLFLLEGEAGRVRQELLKLWATHRQKGLKVGLFLSSPLESGETPWLAFHFKDAAWAAAHLFAELRHMDEAGADIILVEGISEAGLGMAVMNRLRKAAGKNILTWG